MKKIIVALLIFLSIQSLPVCAGTYSGLEPGVSTRQEAIDELGEPLNDSVTNRFDYDSEDHDLRRISIIFHPDNDVIKAIELYPEKTHTKEDFIDWFDLEEPFETSLDSQGSLVEYYLSHGIALHYFGMDVGSGISHVAHFDPVIFGTLPQYYSRPYIGVRLVEHKAEGYKVFGVEKESPAEKAGLKRGDIIVEVNDYVFYQQGLNPSTFMRVLENVPLDKESRVLVRRGEETVELTMVIEKMSQEMIEESIEEAFRVFQQGEMQLAMGNTYGALELFKNAIWLNPDEPLYYTALGDVYYRLGLVEFAIDELEKSIRLQPQHFPYYLLGVIYMQREKWEDAINVFSKAVAINPKDIETRERLATCYFNMNLFADALYHYQKAQKINPDAPVSTYYMAACYDKLHNDDSAIYYYEKFLELDSINEEMNQAARDRLEILKGKVVPAVGIKETQ